MMDSRRMSLGSIPHRAPHFLPLIHAQKELPCQRDVKFTHHIRAPHRTCASQHMNAQMYATHWLSTCGVVHLRPWCFDMSSSGTEGTRSSAGSLRLRFFFASLATAATGGCGCVT